MNTDILWADTLDPGATLEYPTFIFDGSITGTPQTVAAGASTSVPLTAPPPGTLVDLPAGWVTSTTVPGWTATPVLLVPIGIYAVTWTWYDDGAPGHAWNNWVEFECINVDGAFGLVNTTKVRDSGQFGTGSGTLKLVDWTGSPHPGFGVIYFRVINMDLSNPHDITHTINVTRLDA